MADARRVLDWDAQYACALDPETLPLDWNITEDFPESKIRVIIGEAIPPLLSKKIAVFDLIPIVIAWGTRNIPY